MKQSQLIYFITEWTVKVDGEGKGKCQVFLGNSFDCR